MQSDNAVNRRLHCRQRLVIGWLHKMCAAVILRSMAGYAKRKTNRDKETENDRGIARENERGRKKTCKVMQSSCDLTASYITFSSHSWSFIRHIKTHKTQLNCGCRLATNRTNMLSSSKLKPISSLSLSTFSSSSSFNYQIISVLFQFVAIFLPFMQSIDGWLYACASVKWNGQKLKNK